ncbi:MAG: Hsp20/alpha crystallin family protein [Rhodospirillales bacterium]
MTDTMAGASNPNPFSAETTRTRPVHRPIADIYETKDALVVVLELPGVDADGLNVTLDKRVLTVSGRTSAGTPKGAALTLSEYRVADFERSFTLAETIDTDRIEANLKDGVLKVTLPKAGPAPARAIHVNAG